MASDAPELTPRQIEVLELLARGLTNKEIAGVLGIAFGTVRNHVSAVMDALGVGNRTEAALALEDLGLGEDVGDASARAERSFQVPGFGGRPAIAVLPFDDFSRDPDDAYLADAIVEDLITRLSRWRWFPVIARNSTFAYKDRPSDVAAVSRDLGARYVVEGSVRRRGDRIRITVQLIEGPTGHHVWADRYDRELGDIFALQDEIVVTIVGALEPAILRLERIRSVQREPAGLDAWACVQRATHHAYEDSGTELGDALAWLARARELDPDFAPAWALTGLAHGLALFRQRADDPVASLRELVRCSGRAIECDPVDPIANAALGMARFVQGDHAAAIAALEAAVSHQPSFSFAYTGLCMALRFDDARIDDAIRAGETSLRLSPHDPLGYLTLSVLSSAVMMTRRFEKALEIARRSLSENPSYLHAHLAIAGCAGQLGQLDEARASLDTLQLAGFDFSPAHHAIFQPPAVLALCLEGWARTGFVPSFGESSAD